MIFRRKLDENEVDPAVRSEFASGARSTVSGEEDPATELVRLRQERSELIALCLYARDRLSGAAADRIDVGLAEIGITTVRPDGETFDPAVHEAAASMPTDDPALHNTVAETEVPGYADRGAEVRPPIVSVYQQTPREQS
jgi:hypothetical protein